MDVQERIVRFKNMVEADPENELGHFSLAKAYLDGGAAAEAAQAFERVLQLNSGFSKAYQHLAEAQRQLGRTEAAVATLTTGYRVATERGDIMPRDAMATMLGDLGQPLPAVEAPAAPPAAAHDGPTVTCCRCGRIGARLAKPPFKGPLGEVVFANVCQPCWQEWFLMGTKVINELRLDFSNPASSELYDAHLKEFLQLPA